MLNHCLDTVATVWSPRRMLNSWSNRSPVISRSSGPGTSIVGDLASRWEVDTSGTTWTFHLRAGQYWQDGEPMHELFRPVGCSACAKTGYKGRLALHEVMVVSEEIERLAVEKASATVIEHVAKEQGMRTLRDDGLDKVLAGVTSLEEILRVVV